ncbi:fimbrillin family protein [Alistipes sp.]|uniref:fimbrillin family protein n=1 Tax=Alistipes sp. TaxID=1872444 RepID=UPI003AF14457
MEKFLLRTWAFLGCLPLLVFSSCDKSHEECGPKNDGRIEFNAVVSAVTRSTIDWTDFKCEFEPDDAIGIFAVPHGSSLAAS